MFGRASPRHVANLCGKSERVGTAERDRAKRPAEVTLA